MKKFIVCFLVVSLVSSFAFAQETRKRPNGPRRQLATIMFAGLGGAILGLSTLSFYGRPQDQLSNIAIGFAVGVIAGTTYVTFRSATTRDYYDENGDLKNGKFTLPDPDSHEVAQSTLPEKAFQFAPLFSIAESKASHDTGTVLGGQAALHF